MEKEFILILSFIYQQRALVLIFFVQIFRHCNITEKYFTLQNILHAKNENLITFFNVMYRMKTFFEIYLFFYNDKNPLLSFIELLYCHF